MGVVAEVKPMKKQAGQPGPKKPKSEARKHTGMLRVDEEALVVARKAAVMVNMSLADYASKVLRKAAEADLLREAKSVVDGAER